MPHPDCLKKQLIVVLSGKKKEEFIIFGFRKNQIQMRHRCDKLKIMLWSGTVCHKFQLHTGFMTGRQPLLSVLASVLCLPLVGAPDEPKRLSGRLLWRPRLGLFYEPRTTNNEPLFFTSRGLLEAMLLNWVCCRTAASESEAACNLRTAACVIIKSARIWYN